MKRSPLRGGVMSGSNAHPAEAGPMMTDRGSLCLVMGSNGEPPYQLTGLADYQASKELCLVNWMLSLGSRCLPPDYRTVNLL